MKKIELLLILVFGLILFSCRNTEEPFEPHKKETKYTQAFDDVWKTLDTSYVFFDQLPCDWDSLHQVYYKAVESVETDMDFKEFMILFLTEMQDPTIEYSFQHLFSCKGKMNNPALDNFFTWIVWEYSTYAVLNEHMDISMNAGQCVLKTVARFNNDRTDSTRYDGIVILGSPYDPYGQYKALFKTYLHSKYNSSNAAGLIIDLRHWGIANATFISALLEAFYPKGQTCTISAKVRSPFSSNHTTYITAGERSFMGDGYYADKPIAILVNEEVANEELVLATILADLPNVTIIGRGTTERKGGTNTAKQFSDGSVLIYPQAIFSDDKHGSFNTPLQPDILVDWPITSRPLSNTPDKCIEAALDYIDSVN